MFIITWKARVTKFCHSKPSQYCNGNQKLAILQCIGVVLAVWWWFMVVVLVSGVFRLGFSVVFGCLYLAVCANPRSPVGYRRFPVPYLKSPASKQAFSCSMQVISCGVKNGGVGNLLFRDILEGIKNQEAFVSYILICLQAQKFIFVFFSRDFQPNMKFFSYDT